MSKKTIILSSAGLQNINLNQNDEKNNFKFIFGDRVIKMNRIFAEFISPAVSRLHQADPTYNKINFTELFPCTNSSYSIKLNDLFTDNIISHIERLSKGLSTEINKEEGFKIQIISVLLENEELFDNIKHIYPISINEANIDLYIRQMQFIQANSKLSSRFNYSKIVNFIATHFTTIKESELLKLPKLVLYQIIINEHLKIDSEDSLFNFIQKIFINENFHDKTNDNEYSIVDFLENVNISCLTETKFHEFLGVVNINNMTNPLWNKFVTFLSQSFKNVKKRKHYPQNTQCIEYDENSENSFKGIINHLTQKSGGNVHDKKIVKVTASSTYKTYYPKHAVDLDNVHNFFEAVNYDRPDEWLKYDFKNLKIRPSFYSIRSGNMHGGKGFYHLKNWVIEGSNTDEDNDWKVIDARNEVEFLDDVNAAHVFSVQEKLEQNESYRFVRIRSTGIDTGGSYILSLSALEFFGTMFY